VRSHFLRMLERAAIGKVGGDPGVPKRVASDCFRDAGGGGSRRIIRQASGWLIGLSDSTLPL
jgi:hypothetical protein